MADCASANFQACAYCPRFLPPLPAYRYCPLLLPTATASCPLLLPTATAYCHRLLLLESATANFLTFALMLNWKKIAPFARPNLLLHTATACCLLLWSCDGYTPVPKPRAYPRVVYPEKTYVPFEAGYCNFTFDQPAYAKIEQDTAYFEERPKDECWFNIVVPPLNAKIYCSYYPIHSRSEFDKFVSDAFEMTNKHTVKATYIEEVPVHRPADHVHGVVFNVEGPAASSYQFFLTDSVKNFVRGALYFNTVARPDSLAPVVAFMREDLNRMVESLKWQ